MGQSPSSEEVKEEMGKMGLNPSNEVKGGGRIKHYTSSQKILLVGEGDFSFSACLARAFGSANNLFATSLDNLGITSHIQFYVILLHFVHTC